MFSPPSWLAPPLTMCHHSNLTVIQLVCMAGDHGSCSVILNRRTHCVRACGASDSTSRAPHPSRKPPKKKTSRSAYNAGGLRLPVYAYGSPPTIPPMRVHGMVHCACAMHDTMCTYACAKPWQRACAPLLDECGCRETPGIARKSQFPAVYLDGSPLALRGVRNFC